MEILGLRNIFITSDIGGGDPDDWQSFIHMCFYLNKFNLAGFVAGYPKGKKSAITACIKAYTSDYKKYFSNDTSFPTPSALASKSYQGSLHTYASHASPVSPGVKALVKAAHDHERTWQQKGYVNSKLIVTCWGSATEVAQAIEYDPDIRTKIFCFLSGDWNTAQDRNAYQYILKWPVIPVVSCMSSHRGFYLQAINDTSRYGNVGFVQKVIKPHVARSALCRLFIKMSKNINVNSGGIKMGDTPSFLWALTSLIGSDGLPDPNKDSFGGSFARTMHNRWEDHTFTDQKIGIYKGAKTVARHRVEALQDFESRLNWLRKT